MLTLFTRRSYSVKHHPLYVNGDEEKETILKRFLATFEEGDNLLAKVSRERRTIEQHSKKTLLYFHCI